jgi:hypothetical protein
MSAQCIHTNLRNGLVRVRESRYVALTRRLLRHFLKVSMEMPTRARRDQLGPRQFRGPFCCTFNAELGSNFVLHVTSRQIELR